MSGKIHPLVIPAVVLVIVPLIILATDGTECPMFDCTNGTGSIPDVWVCDGDKDCPDGSDEDPDKCSKKYEGITCDDGATWIPSYFECDGFADCYDKTDEENDCCSCPGFYCDWYPQQCIPKKEWKCDGNPQCADGSDEEDCPCDQTKWECESGECIPSFWCCDTEKDCTDGSDETNCSVSALKGGIVASVLVSDKKIKLREKLISRERRVERESHKVSKRLAKTSRLWQK